jgi:hypothetical protein
MAECEVNLTQAPPASPSRFRRLFRFVLLQVLVLIVSLAAIEGILQVLNLRYLRIVTWESLHYQYDPELGWSPAPNTAFDDGKIRPIRVVHNSIGLRDIEHRRGAKPTIIVLGDSMVYGTNVQAEERFTDLLRQQLPDYAVVNAGVSGYGTDQQLLFLKRLWDDVRPQVVLLMYCTDTDRRDNTNNIRYDTYKPYVEISPDGTPHFRGVPVPKSKLLYYRESWLAQHFILARLAIIAYVELKNPRLRVPDPTEHIVGMMRDFVDGKGAKFLVGLQYRDEPLIAYLRAQNIPFASMDGAPDFTSQPKYGLVDFHWSPEGHVEVAKRLIGLFAEAGILRDDTGRSLSEMNR